MISTPKANNRVKMLLTSLTGFFKDNLDMTTGVRLDASTLCQLKCPVCPTGQGDMGILGKGYLRLSDFKNFIEQNPFLNHVELSNFGEIFLNPELTEIMRYAYEKNVQLFAWTGANLNDAREEALEGVVKYQLKGLTVPIDGATADTYKIYRQKGDFNKVIENVKRINFYKDKYKSEFPHLRWQFILFGHNEHEVPQARELAKTLNMELRLIPNWDPSYSPVKDRKVTEDRLKQQERPSGKKVDPDWPWCKQLWLQPQINWDGKLRGCCNNRSVSFGNVFKDGLKECLKNKEYRNMKAVVLGYKQPRKDMPCYSCGEFKDRPLVYRRLKEFRSPFLRLWAYLHGDSQDVTFLTKVGNTLDRNIGRVGIFLKKYSPQTYVVLARIMKKRVD